MKLALVTEFFYPSTGGTQTVVAALAEALSLRGQKVTVFAPLPAADEVPAPPGIGYEVCWLRRRAGGAAGHAEQQLRLLRRLRGFDCIHVFHPSFGLGALLMRAAGAARRTSSARTPPGGRLIATLMGYDTIAGRAIRPSKRLIGSAVCRWADVVTAPSRDLASRARANGVTRRIEIVPHGASLPAADDAAVNALRARLGIAPNHRVCVAVQRQEPVKQSSVLLDAWRRFERDDRRLVLVGGGSLLDSLRHEVSASGLTGVIVCGEVSRAEVPTYLAMADVFVHHARYESFGVAIVEAMAAGLPVVASRVGAVPEIVAHDENGLLVPPGDAAATAAAVERLLVDRSLRRRLGAAAICHATHYRWEAIAEQYERVYDRDGQR